MQVHLYGGKLEDGQTVSVDHSVQKFEVVIRTMNGISSQTLRDFIQQRYEVVKLNEKDRTDYVL